MYGKYTSEENFSTAWSLILKSDELLQKRVPTLKNKIRALGEKRLIKYLKYSLKRLIKPQSLPITVAMLSAEMESENIFIPEMEIENASRLVSKLLPYESW